MMSFFDGAVNVLEIRIFLRKGKKDSKNVNQKIV